MTWAIYNFTERGAEYALRPYASSFFLFGIICAVAGTTPSFWFRLGCLVVWLLAAAGTLLAMHAGISTLAWLTVGGLTYIYRMIKYRNAEVEPDVKVEEHPLIPSNVKLTPPTWSTKTQVIVVVVLIGISIIVIPWIERLNKDWAAELKKDPHSAQRRTQ